MVNQQLVDWLKAQLQAGYGVYQLRSHLLSAGYPLQEVDEAIQAVYAWPQIVPTIPVAPVRHISPKAIAIGAMFAVVILIAGFAIFYALLPPKILLDLNTKPVLLEVQAGKQIDLKVELTNLGRAKRFDVVLEHTITEKRTGKIISTIEETIAVETKATTVTEIPLPADLPAGLYDIRTIARYDGKEAIAASGVRVVAAEVVPVPEVVPEVVPVAPPEIPPVVAPPAPAGPPLEILPPRIKPPVVTPPAPPNITATFAVLKQIRELASLDSSLAIQQCRLLPSADINSCLMDVADISADPAACEDITVTETRDGCYSLLMSKGNYDICDKISDLFIRQSCEQVKQTQALLEQVQQQIANQTQ